MAKKETRTALKNADYFDLSIIGATHGLSDGFASLLIPVLALIVAELGLSAWRAGLLLSIANVSAFVVIFPVSLIADHGGRKKLILLLGMTVATIGFIAMRWAVGFWAIALLALAARSGNAVYHPCGTALTAERFPANRAFAISFHGLMGNIGASLMPVVQAAVAVASGWRWAVVICALPALVLLPMVAFRYPSRSTEKPDDAIRHLGRSLLAISGSVIKNRPVLLLAVIYALKGMGAKALIGFVPLYATQNLGMSTTLVGTALTLYFGAGIAAKPVMGYLYSRWGARAALASPLLLSGFLAAGVGLSPWPPLFLVLLTILGATGPISPIILTAASDYADGKTLASSVGFIYTFYGLGFLSPMAGGFLAERFGLVMPFLLAAFFIWLAAGVSLTLPKKKLQTNS